VSKAFSIPPNLQPRESEIVDALFQSEKSIRDEPVDSCKLRYFNLFEFFDPHRPERRSLGGSYGTDARSWFRSANIYEPGLERESVDGSYSQWLMVHLNRPVDAMRAIHAALKPGGVMVWEEADVSAVYAEPASAAYTELRDICMEGARQRGVDYSGGRRVHLWAKEAGFEIVHVDAYHPHHVTGEHKGFWSWTLRAVGLGMVKEGGLEELVAGMNETDASPDTLVAHCRMHQLIAKKPDMRV